MRRAQFFKQHGVMPDFSLREPRLPHDAEAMAHVQSAANPDWPVNAEQVIRHFETRNPDHFLKVAAMRALQAAGGGQIKTFNDKPNQAMLRMNEGLGFQRTRTIYRYELRLGEK